MSFFERLTNKKAKDETGENKSYASAVAGAHVVEKELLNAKADYARSLSDTANLDLLRCREELSIKLELTELESKGKDQSEVGRLKTEIASIEATLAAARDAAAEGVRGPIGNK